MSHHIPPDSFDKVELQPNRAPHAQLLARSALHRCHVGSPDSTGRTEPGNNTVLPYLFTRKPLKEQKKPTRGTYTFASCQSEGQSINFDYLEMRNFFPAVVETRCAEHGAQRAHQLYLKPVPNITTTLKKTHLEEFYSKQTP